MKIENDEDNESGTGRRKKARDAITTHLTLPSLFFFIYAYCCHCNM